MAFHNLHKMAILYYLSVSLIQMFACIVRICNRNLAPFPRSLVLRGVAGIEPAVASPDAIPHL